MTLFINNLLFTRSSTAPANTERAGIWPLIVVGGDEAIDRETQALITGTRVCRSTLGGMAARLRQTGVERKNYERVSTHQPNSKREAENNRL